MSDLIERQAAIDAFMTSTSDGDKAEWCKWVLEQLPSAQPESTRTFVELVVKYPDPELCAYKEYKGKPYYSIKYIENGETYVGYGTYNPEVLSQYLKEYFISSAQTERKKGKWTDVEKNEYWGMWYRCSECGKTSIRGNFCPKCGADMREDQDDQSKR